MKEDDGLALTPIDDVEGLTMDVEQGHGHAPRADGARGTPYEYRIGEGSGETSAPAADQRSRRVNLGA
jgi:hypothetical protein